MEPDLCLGLLQSQRLSRPYSDRRYFPLGGKSARRVVPVLRRQQYTGLRVRHLYRPRELNMSDILCSVAGRSPVSVMWAKYVRHPVQSPVSVMWAKYVRHPVQCCWLLSRSASQHPGSLGSLDSPLVWRDSCRGLALSVTPCRVIRG
jgi:hypothetical protein